MKKNFSLSSIIVVFLLALCIGLSSLNLLEEVSVPVDAQESCPNLEYGTDALTSFYKGVTVIVSFDQSVSSADREIWRRVFTQWNNLPGAEVKFNTNIYAGAVSYSLTVRTGTDGFTDPSYRGQVLDRYTDENGFLRDATLQIHSNVTNSLAKELTMSHEVAHTLGIGHPVPNDTTTRTAASNRPLKTGMNDTSTGSVGPTDCDLGILPTIYQNGGTRHSSGGGGGGGGSGCLCEDCIYGCNGGGSGGGPNTRNCWMETRYEYDGECGRWDPETGTCYGSDPIRIDYMVCS